MLNINLNAPSICVEKIEMNKQKYFEIIIENQANQIDDLKTNLNVHKDIVNNLLTGLEGEGQQQIISELFSEMLRIKENHADLNEEKIALDSKCLILEQINDEIKFKERETELMFQEQIRDMNDTLERKEFLFQLKEQKWSAIEQVMVNYAREDTKLQRMLADLRYICDDVSTTRNIKNVIQENEELKMLIESQKNTINVLSQRLQENLVLGNSNEITNITQNSSAKKGASDESKKLPDLNCFNVTVVDKEIKFTKKSEAQRMNEKIKFLESTLEQKEIDIRDLKSSNYDLSDSNAKAAKKLKLLKNKFLKIKVQLREIRSQLTNLVKSRKQPKINDIRDILEGFKENVNSDDDLRSSIVSCLTLSNAGSVYYPSKRPRSPSRDDSVESVKRMQLGYHNSHKKPLRNESDCNSVQRDSLDIGDVFLPAESMCAAKFASLKKTRLYPCPLPPQKIDFKKVVMFTEEEKNLENKEPNLRYLSPEKDELNDSVVRISNVRESIQMSEIMAASSRKGESPIRASDLFSRKDADDVLQSIDFK
ncbi:unnamed protein product [Moneuplotes crassus]|uniref:Uncharacterized protein n=1 Tax=Euplotes crassus TaxID=5936 RepID=A0AAD1X6M9_EUPCR|nr:unnamed protein product [Moneuplotes crassus]